MLLLLLYLNAQLQKNLVLVFNYVFKVCGEYEFVGNNKLSMPNGCPHEK